MYIKNKWHLPGASVADRAVVVGVSGTGHPCSRGKTTAFTSFATQCHGSTAVDITKKTAWAAVARIVHWTVAVFERRDIFTVVARRTSIAPVLISIWENIARKWITCEH
jgi:hypothetical protein